MLPPVYIWRQRDRLRSRIQQKTYHNRPHIPHDSRPLSSRIERTLLTRDVGSAKELLTRCYFGRAIGNGVWYPTCHDLATMHQGWSLEIFSRWVDRCGSEIVYLCLCPPCVCTQILHSSSLFVNFRTYGSIVVLSKAPHPTAEALHFGPLPEAFLKTTVCSIALGT